jgi:flagellar biosynthesis protein FlhA
MSIPTSNERRMLSRTLVPTVLVGAIVAMVVPIPAVLLDMLLAVNLAFALLILLAVLTLRDTLDLSTFPSLILITTLMRLALNVSSTRLILLEGYAGKVIETFGSFVVGGSVIVGLVVFLILVVIQFAVITAGAGRVAEVGARFALDAMPGKQMAIDADLAAGALNEVEARQRRQRIAQESEFYGAMDGASKFVKGDAIAGIVIVMINLIGGLVIGITVAGMDVGTAVSTYSLLTVGDGLVSQIPALMISAATGLLVSRVDEDEDLGPTVGRQLLREPRALRTAALVLGAIGLMPGLPKLPFALLVITLLILAARGSATNKQAAEQGAQESEDAAIELDPDDPRALIDRLRIEPLELHLAYDVLDLTDQDAGGDLLQRVRALRRQIADELGVVMPFVRTADDVTLDPATYRILVHGVEVARGTAPRDRVLALPSSDDGDLGGVPGEETVEPVFGLRAWWVPAEARSRVTAFGATVVDRSAVVVTHLAEVARSHAADLLTRQQVQQLLESLRLDEPLLADEVGTETLSMAQLHDVLRELLRERVPIRDLARIVEAVATRARETRSIDQLVGAARIAVGAAIVARIAPGGALGAITLNPELEGELHERVRDIDGSLQLVLEPARLAPLLAEAAQLSNDAGQLPAAIVVGALLRRPLSRAMTTAGINLPVLAYPELPAHANLSVIGSIGAAHVDA